MGRIVAEVGRAGSRLFQQKTLNPVDPFDYAQGRLPAQGRTRRRICVGEEIFCAWMVWRSREGIELEPRMCAPGSPIAALEAPRQLKSSG